MSVINQMLRDLDQRGQGLDATAASPAIRSVAAPTAPPRRDSGQGRARGGVLGLGLLLLALAAAWYGGVGDMFDRASAPAPTSAAPSAVPASPSSATAQLSSAPSVAAPVVVEPAATDAAAPLPPSALPGAPMQLRLDDALEHLPRQAAMPMRSAASAPAVRAIAAVSSPAPAPVAEMRPATTPALERAAVPAAPSIPVAASVVVRPPEPASPSARQLAAARESLAQAQSLWAQGNQLGAAELLRDALPLAERSSAVAGMDAVVVSLVRELARMQLALGRVQEAHDLLTQHEGRTRQNPEVWALRGNAAQRLGQHADSVHAYMLALQSRPTEQRWLLGLAVSLAAMGQTQAANDVTERARAEGPIARDIAAYLRQMGVTVRQNSP